MRGGTGTPRAAVTVALAFGLWLAGAPVAAEEAAPPAVPSLADVAATDSARALPNERPVVGKRLVELRGDGEHVLRSGPGAGYAIVATRREGERFPVLAKSGDWYGVQLSPTETGWIHASLCKERDDLSDLEFRPNAKLYSRTGSFVLSGYGGGYAFDEKSNSAVVGGRLGYYVFDRIVAEAGVSWTRVNRPAEIVESLFGVTLEAEKFSMLFYQMNLAWELLPGRQMVPYVSAGAGSTLLLGRSEPAFNFGAGTRLFLSRRAAMRWDGRDYRFTHHTGTHPIRNDNIEFTLGSEILF